MFAVSSAITSTPDRFCLILTLFLALFNIVFANAAPPTTATAASGRATNPGSGPRSCARGSWPKARQLAGVEVHALL